MNPVLALLLGLAALVVGAELVVREGSAIAARFGISPLVVGMTIVSLGTSLPELAVGLNAARHGNAGLAVGNIVGTNVVNILLILGLSALIRPITFENRTLRIDLPAMIGAAVLLFVLARDGGLTTRDGVWLCLYGAAYLLLMTVLARSDAQRTSSTAGDSRAADGPGSPAGPPAGERSVAREALLLVVGLAVVVAGSEFLVDGAVTIARNLGVTDAVIGLTIVAVGTSAPELVTTLVSTVRGNRDIALGNLLGSSVFNIALILGPTVLVAPGSVPVPDDVLALDLVLMVAAALVCLPVFRTGRRLNRWEGAAFVATYLAYMAWLLTTRL
ncbi:calcium/sodium antiporter [Nocardia carnea]|uniref:calcium/sodium antiporter n=1 Tax=Nocardia carnea TaxID=37328 RepID=UPI002457C945|nr:calcium/sodium antiporter [Nocardia carnea]